MLRTVWGSNQLKGRDNLSGSLVSHYFMVKKHPMRTSLNMIYCATVLRMELFIFSLCHQDTKNDWSRRIDRSTLRQASVNERTARNEIKEKKLQIEKKKTFTITRNILKTFTKTRKYSQTFRNGGWTGQKHEDQKKQTTKNEKGKLEMINRFQFLCIMKVS